MRKKTYLLLGIALLTTTLTLIFALPKIWEISKQKLAEKHLKKSQEFYLLESYGQAYSKAKEAQSLLGDKKEILLMLAHAGSMTKEKESLIWWSKIIHTSEWDTEALEKWNEHCISLKHFDIADFYTSQLLTKNPDNLTAQTWNLEALKRKRKYKELIDYSTELIETGDDRDSTLEHYSFAQLSTVGKDALIQKLSEYAKSDLPVKLTAINYLLSKNLLSNTDSEDYAEILIEKSDNNYNYLLLGLSTKANLNPEKQLEYSKILIEKTDINSNEELSKCIFWHNNRKLSAISSKIISPTIALENRELYIAYIDTLLLNDEAQAAYELTLQPLDTIPVNKTENLILRARSLNKLGNEAELNEALKTAAETAEFQDFSLLEKTLSKGGKWDILIMMYERLIENSRTKAYGNTKLVIANYFLGNTFELRKHLREVDLNNENKDPMVRNHIIYLKLLLDDERIENYKNAEELATTYSNIYDFRIPLALSYYLQNKADIALDLISPVKQFSISQPRYYKIVCAAILQQNGKTDEALQSLGALRIDSLLPAEKLLIKDLILEQRKANATASNPSL